MPLAICATPIGNLDDVTLRVLDELRHADVVLCEDTRRTRVLLDRHELDARLVSYQRYNEAARVADTLARLGRGERIALVSDAGLPGVNDPGARLIEAALDAGLPVTVLPGPSAVETALVASGLISDRYRFVGYLPRRDAERRSFAREVARWPYSLVAFESPRRLPASLAVLAGELSERPAAVCRELTKRFEEVARGTLGELAERFSAPPRGEITLVLGPDPAASRVADRPSEGSAHEAVAELVGLGVPRRSAVGLVSRLTGMPRNALYRGSL